MIYRIVDYWVAEGMTPTLDDVKDAVEAAKKHGCTVRLNWKGPGYRWHGDTYSTDVTSESDAQEIYNNLPKSYGL